MTLASTGSDPADCDNRVYRPPWAAAGAEGAIVAQGWRRIQGKMHVPRALAAAVVLGEK